MQNTSDTSSNSSNTMNPTAPSFTPSTSPSLAIDPILTRQNTHPLLINIPSLHVAFNSLRDPPHTPTGAHTYGMEPNLLLTLQNTACGLLAGASQPVWDGFLQYFFRQIPRPHPRGILNLQNLHLLLIRVLLPWAIIRNRELVLEMYLAAPTLSQRVSLRYDAWPDSYMGQMPFEPRRFPVEFSDERAQGYRPVFLWPPIPMPPPEPFLQWLNAPAIPPPILPYNPFTDRVVVPAFVHRPSEIDIYLADREPEIRGMTPDTAYILRPRVLRVLQIYWFVCTNNSELEKLKKGGWEGVHNYMYAV
ncbi:hypothetical protein P154DRAFT_519853 [Amniculicola lignicola CBS 123094]|uniref:Uncharacterized protein n=1 Tax=Amniculicola lignicola CBS 123094 TaxID=1392246 RepID=A0A6A5WTU4_9PLEO|nr:hypothetical protein P154DRAFT_519853 [Amniculicola lignicola CBS 123094]